MKGYKMSNKIIVERTLKRVYHINKFLKAENMISVGYNDGKGNYIEFPENSFTLLLMCKKIYVNYKNMSYVNFLLNKYEECLKEEILDNLFSIYYKDNFLEMFKKEFENVNNIAAG
jgi:hypothetical protein